MSVANRCAPVATNAVITVTPSAGFKACDHGDAHIAVFARAFLVLDGIVLRDLPVNTLYQQYRCIVPRSAATEEKVHILFVTFPCVLGQLGRDIALTLFFLYH